MRMLSSNDKLRDQEGWKESLNARRLRYALIKIARSIPKRKHIESSVQTQFEPR